MTAGADPPMPMAPMEPVLVSEPFDGDEWIFQVKWDGVRCLAYRTGDGVSLFSRRQREQTLQFPELRQELSALPAGTVVDGEVVVPGEGGKPDFFEAIRRVQLRSPARIASLAGARPVRFMAFDLLWLAGERRMDRPVEQRLEELDAVLPAGTLVRPVDSFPGQGRALFEAVSREGMEGTVGKQRLSRYLPGQKSPLWKKVKAWREMDVAVVGWTEAEGELRSLLMGVPGDGKFLYAGNVSSGLTGEQRRVLQDYLRSVERNCAAEPAPRLPGCRFAEPVLGLRVRYLETTPDGRLRNPVIVGIHERKDHHERS